MKQNINSRDHAKAPVNYDRLLELCDRAHYHQASKEEKDELMKTLYDHGKLTEQLYHGYKDAQDTGSDIVFAVSIAAMWLWGHKVAELVRSGSTRPMC